jgi:DNA-binding NtrC family response regulator
LLQNILDPAALPARKIPNCFVKSGWCGPHTRLIILADESAPSCVIDSMRERALSYFFRPFSLNALSDMVQNAMEGPCWDDRIEVLQ